MVARAADAGGGAVSPRPDSGPVAPAGTPPAEVTVAFHRLVGQRPAPMLVVTTVADGERAGCLVGFATQCSITPPAFLVCLSIRNHTFRVAEAATHLAVHHLTADQLDLARHFGELTGDEVDKFAGVAWAAGPEGVPVLDGVLGWFVGRIDGQVDLGDHRGFWLHPVAAHAPEELGEALTLADVADLIPGHEA